MTGRNLKDRRGALDNAAGSSDRDWRTAWGELLHFMNAAPGIAYTRNSISFDSVEAKSHFYELFNIAINCYLNQGNGGTASIDYDGIQALRAVERSISSKAGITQVRHSQMLMKYMDMPELALARALFGAFMLLAQGQAPVNVLEETVPPVLQASITGLNRFLFEAWLCFALIDYLHPVEFRMMVLDDDGELRARRAETLEVGSQVPLKDYRLPEAAFRTAKGTCYAYKFENSNEIAYYTTPNKCKDVTAAGNTSSLMCHRTLMLYRISDFDKVPVLARRSLGYSLAPGLMVEHLSEEEHGSRAVLSQVRKRPLSFGMDVPLHIVLREPSPMGAAAELPCANEYDGSDDKSGSIAHSTVMSGRIPHPLSVYRLGYEGHELDQILEPLLQ